jgi:outer membrane protein OmpA-like peptidoglycan-associated protein
MRGGSKSVLFTAGSLVLVMALTGCAGRSTKASSTPRPTEPAVATATPATATPSVPTAMPVARAETTSVPSTNGFVALPELADVRFRAGLVTVGKADAAALDVVVRWLKDNPGAEVRIEGHTDDRGNRAENIAVGEKRAMSVMKYLIAKGLEPQRISIVSYGSERPVCAEKTETCRAQNRRTHFLVKQR